ncbi:methyl-accepting chemotaxis protein [Campylobacterota bacterium]|nr:methyl-accepting chemotaxis protein [Campylobacterota bacterium]
MTFLSSIRGRLLIATLLLNLAAVGIYTIYAYSIRRADMYEAIDSRLVAAAYLGAEIAPQSVHDEAAKGNMEKEDFDYYQRRLYDYVAALGVKYIYTIVEIDGVFHFVVDTALEEEIKSGVIESEPLYEYEEPSEALVSAYRNNQMGFDEDTDEWGTFRSVFIPLKTDSGTRFMASADIEIDTIDALLRETLLTSIAIAIAFFAVSSAVSWFCVSFLLRPIGVAQGAVRHITNTLDLKKRLSEDRNEIGLLCADLNQLVSKLQDAIVRANKNATDNAVMSQQLESSSAHIYDRAKANQETVKHITENSTEAGTLLAKMETAMNDAQKDVSQATAMLIDSRSRIADVAEMIHRESGTQHELSSKLTQLSKESDQVKNVLGVIGDIADQTNLLALNAAIEAARAGEHGRGFAVVADEVRKLAERTQKSLAETGATVTAIVQSIEEAAGVIEENVKEFERLLVSANDAQKAIEDGATQIGNAKTTLGTTAANSKLMIEKTNGVLASVVEISDRTNESTASIQEIATSASHLNKQSGALKLELAKFTA